VWLRRSLQGLIHRYVPMSADLERWLIEEVGVGKPKVMQIYNCVDCERFHPSALGRAPLPIDGFAPSDCVVIGSVGRMDPVKDQLTLVRRFAQLVTHIAQGQRRVRLVHIGDGELREPAQAVAGERPGGAGLASGSTRISRAYCAASISLCCLLWRRGYRTPY
jgi:glycosyltransferase involved in cell wall biosynthesis